MIKVFCLLGINRRWFHLYRKIVMIYGSFSDEWLVIHLHINFLTYRSYRQRPTDLTDQPLKMSVKTPHNVKPSDFWGFFLFPLLGRVDHHPTSWSYIFQTNTAQYSTNSTTFGSDTPRWKKSACQFCASYWKVLFLTIKIDPNLIFSWKLPNCFGIVNFSTYISS